MIRSSRWWLGLVGCALAGAVVSSAVAADGLFSKKKDSKADKSAKASPDWSAPVAEVNGEPITVQDLAIELIDNYGKKHLEMMVNRKLVAQACKTHNVEVTRADLDNEIKDTLKKLNISRKEFVERVLERREITYGQYLRDTVWPALAMQKLVADRVTVTEEDLTKAFEANYGEKVDVRMLVIRELRKSQEMWDAISKIEDPEKRIAAFEDCCKIHSVDAATRSFGGRCAPINKHSSFPEIEKLAFGLKPNELSSIIQVPEGHLMLLCVARIPAQEGITMDTVVKVSDKGQTKDETVREMMQKDIHEKKIRVEISSFFADLRAKAKVNNFMTADFAADELTPTSGEESPDDGKNVQQTN